MPTNDQIPNQINSQTSQNFDIDIDSIYNDFIKEIDATRSIVNISNQGNQAFLNTLKKETIASLAKLVKTENTPQESRCHAFFRLVGFPVVSKDFDFYNPGFDVVDMSSKKLSKNITLDFKLNVANNAIEGFRSLSFFRENYINRFLQIFSQTSSITAGALALSSSTQTRNFTVPVQNDDPFDMSQASSTYVANLKAQVGQLDQVFLFDYVDEQGNKPKISQLQTNRYHFIKPFMVDPRIDFTVSPSTRKVAVPFVFDKSNLLISENTFVKRPLLEKIIRERLIVQNQSSTLGSADKAIKDYILNIPSIKDDQLIKQMTSDNSIYKTSEQQQFNKYLHIIGAMIFKLVESQLKIQVIQSKYYWLPVPSNIGPEGGSDVKNIIISEKFPSELVTTSDKSLIDAVLKQVANQFNVQTAEVNSIPNIGDFAFGPFTSSFSNDTSQSLGDIATEVASDLNKSRNHDLSQANNALRTIEIIMGEFSGFGLCDIIAIMGSLYIMPIENLLGFLDSDAFSRMTKVLSLKDVPGQSNITSSMNSLMQTVKDFYNLMDKIYQDTLKNNNNS